MGRGCCEGATGLCNCLVRSASNNVLITQPEQGVYDIEVVDGAVADICASLQGLTDASRGALSSDKLVAVDAGDNCVLVDASTSAVNGSLPAGLVMGFASDSIPAGFILCDGRQLPQGSYPDLFNALATGSIYGTNGTNFYIPDLRARTIQGSNGGTHILGAAGGSSTLSIGVGNLPNHVHGMSFTVTTGGEDAVHVHTINGNTSNYVARKKSGTGGYGPSLAAPAADDDVTIDSTDGPTYLSGTPTYHRHDVAINGVTNATQSANGTAITHRPEHIAMNWVIKT